MPGPSSFRGPVAPGAPKDRGHARPVIGGCGGRNRGITPGYVRSPFAAPGASLIRFAYAPGVRATFTEPSWREFMTW